MCIVRASEQRFFFSCSLSMLMVCSSDRSMTMNFDIMGAGRGRKCTMSSSVPMGSLLKMPGGGDSLPPPCWFS